MKYNRLQEIEQYLQVVKSATNKELMEHFDISMQTLRRDVKELEDKGFLKKIYGGVVLCDDERHQGSILDINVRKITNIEQKQKIGELAANIVEEEDVIFVDSGTTAFHLLPFLAKLRHVTVLSHSLHVMCAIAEMENVTAICLGGVYHPQTWTFHGDASLQRYRYNKAFISTVGISIHQGCTNTDVDEGNMKSYVMEHANEVYILADASKFGVVAFHQFADVSQVDGIITNDAPKEAFLNFFKKAKIKVIYK